jgi:hypothetical protein
VGVLGLVWANFLNFCVVWRGAVPPVVRRKRDDRKQLAIMYAELFKRIPRSPTAKSLANEFADKEIRVLMSQNGMLINDLDPKSGRYVEKTKLQKIESLLSVIDTLILPNVLMLRANVQTRSDGSGATRGGESFLRVHWVAVPKVMRARRVNRRWRVRSPEAGQRAPDEHGHGQGATQETQARGRRAGGFAGGWRGPGGWGGAVECRHGKGCAGGGDEGERVRAGGAAAADGESKQNG